MVIKMSEQDVGIEKPVTKPENGESQSLARSVLNRMTGKAIAALVGVALVLVFIILLLGVVRNSEVSVFGIDITPSSAAYYTVVGTVTKTDGGEPKDISIFVSYPPKNPSYQGDVYDMKVFRDPEGRLPTLKFVHDDYNVQPVDLNKKKIDEESHEIDIGRVEMKRNE